MPGAGHLTVRPRTDSEDRTGCPRSGTDALEAAVWLCYSPAPRPFGRNDSVQAHEVRSSVMRVPTGLCTPPKLLIWLLCMLPSGCSLLPPTVRLPFEAEDPAEARFLTTSERIESIRELKTAAAQLTPADQLRYSEGLAKTFQTEPNAMVRLELARTLGAFATPAAEHALIMGTRDGETRIRMACCEMLAERPGDEPLRTLTDIVANDQDVDTRLAAVRALGVRRDAKAVPALAVALEDRDPALQYRAVESLREVTGKDVGNDVKDWIALVHGETVAPPPSLAKRLIPWF